MHPDRVLLEVVDRGELLAAFVARNTLGFGMNAALVKPEVVLGGKALPTVVTLMGGFIAAGPASLSPPLSTLVAV